MPCQHIVELQPGLEQVKHCLQYLQLILTVSSDPYASSQYSELRYAFGGNIMDPAPSIESRTGN